MAQQKRKVVFTADPRQLRRIDELVSAGTYRTTSEFLREAIDDKLASVFASRLGEEVARYVAAGHAGEDDGVMEQQAFDDES
jgi:Arc/MetJ-type ribon-helix-helix transcriptional regulator